MVERSVQMEIQLGNDAELVVLQISELKSDSLLIFHNMLKHILRTIGGEDTQIDMCDAQVWRNAHLTYGDEQIADTFSIAQEDIAKVLLHEAGDFLLTGSLHSNFKLMDTQN